MLFIPGGANSFEAVQESATGRPATAWGASVTPAVGSKSTPWVELIASLSHDTYGLMVNINSGSTIGASRNTVLDIGIGAASSEVVLIPDLICGNAGTYSLTGSGLWYYFPIFIPAGARVSARSQSSVATAFNVAVTAFQKPLNPSMLKAASYVIAVGMTVPQGTAVTVGTTSEGAWTSLGTTSKDAWWWQVGAQVQSADTSHQTAVHHIDLAVGDGSNKRIIMNSVPLTTNASEWACNTLFTLGCEVFVPSGSTLYARSQSSTTVDPLYITAYGAGG